MRILATLIPCALLLTVATAAEDATDPDLAKLQGRWTVESFAYNGNPVEMMSGAVREFKDSRYTLSPKVGDPIEGSAKIDSTKKPKFIDLDVAGRMLKGIYEIDGDTLKMCYKLVGTDRPIEMASTPESGIVLVTHKRVK